MKFVQTTRVLVIDDEPPIQALLKAYLAAFGLPAPVCADNGEQALALIAASERFDIIFCDVFMPGMDGIEFVLKTDYDGPIVMMSGKTETMLEGAAMLGESDGANIVDKILKPFSADQVKAALAKAGLWPGDQTA